MKSKSIVFLSHLLISSSFLGFAAHAGFEDDLAFKYKTVGSCLKEIQKTQGSRLPQLMIDAETNEQSLKKLQNIYGAILALPKVGYQPIGSQTDARVPGIQNFFKMNKKKIDGIIKDPPVFVSQLNHFPSHTAQARKSIFDENQRVAKKGGYIFNNQQIKVNTKNATAGNKVYGTIGQPYQPNVKLRDQQKPFKQTSLHVVNDDTVNFALQLKKAGKNALSIDMANAQIPGGGAFNGHGNVQEEQMAYRSDLYAHLKPFADNAKRGKSNNFIPEQGGIYLPRVSIFRQDAPKGYSFVDQPEELAIGAIAAWRHPNRGPKAGLDENFYPELKNPKIYWETTEKKLEAFFDMALENGHTVLNLSAFGCGAFKNPPQEMIKAFQRVIQKYAGCFDEIYFAIKATNPKDKNFNLFSQAFDKKVVVPVQKPANNPAPTPAKQAAPKATQTNPAPKQNPAPAKADKDKQKTAAKITLHKDLKNLSWKWKSPSSKFQKNADGSHTLTTDTTGAYQVSYSFNPPAKVKTVKILSNLDVSKGAISLGVLNNNKSKFIGQKSFGVGKHTGKIEAHLNGEKTLTLIISNNFRNIQASTVTLNDLRIEFEE